MLVVATQHVEPDCAVVQRVDDHVDGTADPDVARCDRKAKQLTREASLHAWIDFLSACAKTAFATGRLQLDPHVVDLRAAWPAATPGYQRVHLLRLALEHRFDRPVDVVAHPTVDAA